MKIIIIAAVAVGAALASTAPVNTAFAGECSGPRPDATYECKCQTFTVNRTKRERICSWTKTRR